MSKSKSLRLLLCFEDTVPFDIDIYLNPNITGYSYIAHLYCRE